MIHLAMIRHGPTDWNEAKRIQGHADRGLSVAGREAVARWTLPGELAGLQWYASPLSRARETARLLGIEPRIAPVLIEMDWGEWEGLRSAEIRARYGPEFERRTSMGLDMRPHGGESPRELRARLAAWLADVSAAGRPAGAVCHLGVIRAVLSLATGWDMIAKPPVQLEWAAAHLFALDASGTVSLERANIMLDGS